MFAAFAFRPAGPQQCALGLHFAAEILPLGEIIQLQAEGSDTRPTFRPPGPRRATGETDPRACVQRALLPMEPGLTPVAVPTRGPSTRTVLVAVPR